MNQNLHFFKTHYVYDQASKQKTVPREYNIEPALNSILATVHQRLKYNPKPSTPKIPRAIADTMSQRPEVLLAGSRNNQKRRNFGKRTIPQLQADREIFNMQKGRRNLTTSMMTFRNQQRYHEVLRQKRILENMLQEHQKLQSDRDNIASEINYMRSYLDNIRTKLDVSLRKLNTQKTVSNQACPNKKITRVQPNLNTTVKKPVSTSAVNVRVTRTNRTNTRQRISGGGYSQPIPTSSKMSTTRKTPSSIGDKKKTNLKNSKQWVYCTRIDRSAERRLH